MLTMSLCKISIFVCVYVSIFFSFVWVYIYMYKKVSREFSCMISQSLLPPQLGMKGKATKEWSSIFLM